MNTPERLFIAHFPAGIGYADMARERNGDYVQLAFLSYSTLVLEMKPRCPPELAELIRNHAATLQSRAGEKYVISGCGQTVLLGERLRGLSPGSSETPIVATPHAAPPPAPRTPRR